MAIRKRRIAYFIFTVFILVFGLIYEFFSHEVYSYYMLLAFLIPLAGGLVSELHVPSSLSQQFLTGGVVWLTLGCVFQGVLEIYGTTNRLSIIFAIVGLVLVATSIVIRLVNIGKYNSTATD
ncbi:MAG: hypothetical protein K6B67_06480 [Lachnospiraceae bacterium]|nr:hypothetical protein [Lachnospiraceae bacterium]